MTARWAFAARPALSAGCDGPDETLRQTLGPDGLAWGEEPTFGQGTDSWPPTLLAPTLLPLDLLRKTDPRFARRRAYRWSFGPCLRRRGSRPARRRRCVCTCNIGNCVAAGFRSIALSGRVDRGGALPHQIETVRKVLRRFRGRVLLADEVGLGKTIEACLLLREYLLRGLAKRVLILVPTPLVSQWREELASKFHLEFSTPPRTGAADRPEYWQNADRVLASLAFTKSRKRAELVTEVPWDLVIVNEAHHCKNRATQNWRLVNALKRRHLFLLTATPVQNNLLELYNLLTLLEPGHLKTETDFKRQYVRRGNPAIPATASGCGRCWAR